MANEAKKVEEPKEIKFTDEELESLQGLQTSYQEKQSVLGQLAVQKILLNYHKAYIGLPVIIFIIKISM